MLKTQQAENDARQIAEYWKEYGFNAATVLFNQIVQRKGLVRWEASVLAARIREIHEEIS